MKVIAIENDEMYQLLDEPHNPPVVQNKQDEATFQAEVRGLYKRLVESLSRYGDEGDYYGISDFAVRPDLRNRRTTIPPPAPHNRQFIVTILTEKYFRSGFLKSLRSFLSSEARAYRVRVDQDFSQGWCLAIFLTADLAQINCTDVEVASRLRTILTGL